MGCLHSDIFAYKVNLQYNLLNVYKCAAFFFHLGRLMGLCMFSNVNIRSLYIVFMYLLSLLGRNEGNFHINKHVKKIQLLE